MHKALAGLVVALALAVSFSGATFFGIDAWKIVLAAAGAVIFVMGAERRPRGDR
jgi:membrane-bound ClpP family serine protease